MRVAVIGTGYVGLVTGVCLAEHSHNVTMIDIDEDKIIKLAKRNEPPFYEPGLAALMRENSNRLYYAMNFSAVSDCDVVIIAVGAPSGKDVKDEMEYVFNAVYDIQPYLSSRTAVIIKSTVPPCTNAKISEILPNNEIISNPEFLREGSAIADTLTPERIVVGANSPLGFSLMESIYKYIEAPLVCMDPESAEMVKYASNSFLAMKISFINEIANICEAVGADVYTVKRGMELDSRIGDKFLEPGPGYGGSCFPKDVKALARVAEEAGAGDKMLVATDNVNYQQKFKTLKVLRSQFGPPLNGLKVAVLGLAFKANTDDTRESPALKLIKLLQAEDAIVTSHDPQATINNVGQCDTVDEAIKDAHVAVIMTEWRDYFNVDWTVMQGHTLVDARGMYKHYHEINGINNYYCIGKGWTNEV